MRVSAVLGAIFLIAGVVLLYVLRHLLFQVIVVLLGVIGLIIAVVLIVVGLALIFGKSSIGGRFRRYVVTDSLAASLPRLSVPSL